MFCLFCQLLDSWAHRFFRHSSFLKVQPAGISADLDSTSNDAGHSSPTRKSIHPPPAFGSSPNLEALALAASLSQDEDADNSVHNNSLYSRYFFSPTTQELMVSPLFLASNIVAVPTHPVVSNAGPCMR
jgi:hypothetical protein